MTWYRCTLEDLNKAVTITLDILADGSGVIDSGLIFFGYYRDNTSVDNSPFAVTFDGQVDWGSATFFTGLLEVHGKTLGQGVSFPFVVYESHAAMKRGQQYWSADLIVQDYRNHSS